MRVLIILAAIVLLLAVVGWISFSNESDRSTINLETDEIREDTGEMMRSGSELLRGAGQEITQDPSSEVDPAPRNVE